MLRPRRVLIKLHNFDLGGELTQTGLRWVRRRAGSARLVVSFIVREKTVCLTRLFPWGGNAGGGGVEDVGVYSKQIAKKKSKKKNV